MSHFLTIIALVVALTQTPGKLETSYDKFKDRTTVETDYMRVSGSTWNSNPLEISARFVYPGTRPARPERVAIFFYAATTNNWPFKTEPALIAIADGNRFDLGSTVFMDGDARFDGRDAIWFHQYLATAIPFATFERIANASSVEMQLGSSEFRLNGKTLATFHELARRARTND